MKVLIVKLSSLGDLFHALPAVHNLKEGLKAEIHWAVQAEYASIVRCFTDVRRVIQVPRHNVLSKGMAFVKELRAEYYDYVVDLQGLLKSAMVARLARGARRIGPSFAREGSSIFYSELSGKRNKGRHAVEECLDVVRHLGLEKIPEMFPVNFPKVQVAEKVPRVALLPASRWATKNWPAERFAEVAAALFKARGASIFIVGGPQDSEVCLKVEKMAGCPVVNTCGRYSIESTGGLITQMDLLISNDSGPVHMAAAMNVPCVVIFGPTDPVRTGPWGNIHKVLQAKIDCVPCFSRLCRGRDLACLRAITAREVTATALDMLSDSGH